MSNQIIHTAFLNNYRPLFWKGIPVYKRTEGINGLLKDTGIDEEFQFTNPLVTADASQNKEAAYWLSEITNAKNYSTLSPAEQQQALSKYKQAFEKINNIVDDLRKSENADQKELAEVLLLALQIPSLDCIYLADNKILVALWGFANRDAEKWNFNIFKVLQQIDTNDATGINQTSNDQASGSTTTTNKEFLNNNNPGDNQSSDEKTKRSYQKWLLPLGIAAIALLVFYFFFINKQHNYLPPVANRYSPYDTTKVISAPDSKLGRKIVGNRLNALVDSNTALKDFAYEFKSQYTDDKEVKIVFYDTTLHSIQIEFYKQDLKYWAAKLKGIKGCKNVYKESVLTVNRIPSDPGFAQPLINYPYNITGVYNAWDRTEGDKFIVVAVIDNGFDLKHNELNSRIFKPFSEVTNNGDVSYGIYANNVHGTHVGALAIGNANNGSGASGFAPNCRFMPIQVALGYSSMSGIIRAIEYAIDNGADVINLSLGFSLPPDKPKPSYEEQLEEIRNNEDLKIDAEIWERIYRRANKFNCIIVEAAGNDNLLADLDPMKRSALIINVGACDAVVKKAPFSNFGKSVSVTAPGVHIFSAVPGNKYAYMQGTSMASPIVSGGVALMKSLNHNLNVAEVKKILIQTGVPVNTTPGYSIGPLVQFDKAINNVFKNKDPCQKLTDSLKQVIDSLKNQIKNPKSFLKIPPNTTDCSFAKGDWKSDNDLLNHRSHEKVQLLFKFGNNCQGKLFFIEKNKTCNAGITMKIEKGMFKITQITEADCDNKLDKYQKYYFECVPGANGVAQCKAFALQSKQQVIDFKLYRN